jgi:hypothetical protein
MRGAEAGRGARRGGPGGARGSERGPTKSRLEPKEEVRVTSRLPFLFYSPSHNVV